MKRYLSRNKIENNYKEETMGSVFIPIILSIVTSALILGMFFPNIKEIPESYYDIIAQDIARMGTNKSGELRLIWITFIIGTISIFIYHKIYHIFFNKENMIISNPRYEKNDKCILEILGLFIIPNIVLYIFTENINYYLLLGGSVYIFFMLYEKMLGNEFESDEEFPKRVMLCIIMTYYCILGVLSLLNSLNLTNKISKQLVQVLIIVITLVVLYSKYFRKNTQIVNNLILGTQLIIPLNLFIYLINRYEYDGKLIELPYPNNYCFIIYGIIVGLVLYAYYNFKKVVKLKKIPISKMILPSTIICLFIINMFRDPNYIYSTDLWHTGEILLPWHQIVDKGLIPYKEYSSQAGLFPMLFGFIHNMLLVGTATTYNFSWSLQYMFIAILVGILMYYCVGSKISLIISMVTVISNYNRTLVILPVILLLCYEKLIKNKIYWLEIWLFCCFISGIYYPVYGVGIFLGTLPFAIIQIINVIKEKRHINIVQYLVLAIESIVIIFNIPLLIRMAKHILLMSSQSILADGISVVGISKPTNWFWNIFNDNDRLRNLIYIIFEFSIPIFYSVVFVFLLFLYLKKNRKRKLSEIIQSPIMLLLNMGIITLPITYIFGFVRMDETWFLGRAAYVIMIFSGIVLPIILWKYGKLICNKSISMTLMGISIAITIMIGGSNMGNEINNIKNKYVVNSEEYEYVNNTGIENLGNGFVTKFGLNITETVNDVMKLVLKEDESIFLFSGNQALYYILDQSTPVPDAAICAVTDRKTQDIDIKALNENPPMLIQWNSDLGIKNYYIFKWMIEKGYVPYTKNNVNFFIHPKRYRELFDDYTKKVEEMTSIYSIDFFTVRNLEMICNSWGKSKKDLNNIFESYKEIEVNNDNIQVENLTKNIDGFTNRYSIEESKNNKLLFITLQEAIKGSDSDFLYLDLDIKNADKTNFITIYWTNGTNSFTDSNSLICNLGDGKLLIPLGVHPSWLLNENSRIAINFNECQTNLEFDINKIEFLNLKDN